MLPEQFSLLLDKYLSEELNSEELSNFLLAAKDDAHQRLLYEKISLKLEDKSFIGLSQISEIDSMFHQMLVKVKNEKVGKAIIVEMPVTKRFSIFPRIVAASAILIFVIGVIYYMYPQKNEAPLATQTERPEVKNDIAPGSHGAILTLSNGKKIILDSTHKGIIANQGNTEIIKDSNGLAYTKGNSTEVLYNTMTTLKGRQYNLVLSDGSKVWLNAASSITFPTVFTNGVRKVSITGEAYFEVAHNAAMPFVVEKGGTSVRVLGTHFNVNTYEDENSINVTLLEGSVNVENENNQRIIRPGQQAQVLQNGSIQLSKRVVVEEVMAWKNERFVFESASIKSIMRQVARWYNVDVDYKADIPYSFVANISMNLPVSELLKLLELTGGVHFKVDGNTITVMK